MSGVGVRGVCVGEDAEGVTVGVCALTVAFSGVVTGVDVSTGVGGVGVRVVCVGEGGEGVAVGASAEGRSAPAAGVVMGVGVRGVCVGEDAA